MAFPPEVRINLLVKCGRRCCLCWKFCGTKIEVHHIIQEANGGSDDEDNGIPLCLDCHAEVLGYNDRHPRGTKFRPEELRQHRERLFRVIEEKGPLVFDALAREAFPISHDALVREDATLVFTCVDLQQEAKVARYLRYIRAAEDSQRQRRFKEAIRRFEAAFTIAESDATLEDYAQSGNYYLRKLLLWECHLEEAARSGDREHLRAVFNMAIDENTIGEIRDRDRFPGGLSCQNYFYLLLQEKLFLFDHEIRGRKRAEERLARIAQLMDLIENPHCPDHEEDLIKRARDIEREVRGRLAEIVPGVPYVRDEI